MQSGPKLALPDVVDTKCAPYPHLLPLLKSIVLSIFSHVSYGFFIGKEICNGAKYQERLSKTNHRSPAPAAHQPPGRCFALPPGLHCVLQAQRVTTGHHCEWCRSCVFLPSLLSVALNVLSCCGLFWRVKS
ncbi:hypothetical protein GDO81_021402 [Engystomops pustulosus]|uniref:Uncharacterized protein n=1 Tax=Engystomops pustulosus TaxID=76066 RepID=A0AAV6ZJL6_ENGPU|nr:hypothetical protein GDO81_021402 [Engystomops pustulosus]